ncbi:hypothetical protein [Mucisphaera calidilacus]|uniref:Uncharacterized protein n=1 Tax=Mucisphaera calidilacus TaxID=2527982 RepID=A0A518BZU9_9BACT|nr:hypothetical protein [Mucisphaera calidilacus]QDU72497.1 hypothetical protein Pan265_23630 [Mucisphaera calidilacus]
MKRWHASEDHAGLSRAIERLQVEVQSKPSLAHRSLLARMLARAERLAEANEMYRSVCMDADAPDALIDEAARCAEQVGDLRGAEIALRSVLTQRDSETLHTRLAEFRLCRGAWTEAAFMAWGLTNKNPENVDAWTVLTAAGWVTGRRGMTQAGIEALRREDPRGGSNRLGALLARALPAIMAEQKSEDPSVTRRLRQWRGVEAFRVAQQSSAWDRLMVRTNRAMLGETSRRPRHADAWYHLARADMALGDRSGAVDGLSRALGINPGYQKAQAELEKVCRQRAA